MSTRTAKPRAARTRPRPALLRGQAAIFGLVFIAGQLGSFLHGVFEQHARCLEHGEIVHVPQGGQHGLDGWVERGPDERPNAALAVAHRHVAPGSEEAAPVLLGPSPDAHTAPGGRWLLKAPVEDDGHDHDHCYLSTVSRERMCGNATSSVAALFLDGAHVVSLAPTPAPVALARYIVAPKTSPPAA